MELTAPLIKDKERFRRILKQLVLLFRDACVLRAGGASCLSHQPEAAGELAHTLTRDQLMRLLEYAQSAQKAQDQNANAALLVTTFCARMRPRPTGGMHKSCTIEFGKESHRFCGGWEVIYGRGNWRSI